MGEGKRLVMWESDKYGKKEVERGGREERMERVNRKRVCICMRQELERERERERGWEKDRKGVKKREEGRRMENDYGDSEIKFKRQNIARC